jgi:hypothetical protein
MCLGDGEAATNGGAFEFVAGGGTLVAPGRVKGAMQWSSPKRRMAAPGRSPASDEMKW